MPHSVQMTRHKPTLPEYSNAEVGDIKMPEPIITPMMIFIAAKSPIFCFNPTSVSLTAAVNKMIKNL